MPTGVTYTSVTDDTGHFNASNIKSRFVEVFAEGYYFDELNNMKSKAPVTLRAILDLKASASKPSINTLTTMQTERLRTVKAQGKTFEEAETDSKNAVLRVFGLPTNTVTRLDNINLTGTSAGDEALLRATVALLQVASNKSTSVEAELTTIVAKLASDLKDDGQANGAGKDFVAALQSSQTQVDTELVRSMLQDYLGVKGQPEPQVIGTTPAPKLSQWISLRRERVYSEGDVAPVVWLLREDGAVWKWSLVSGQNLQQVTAFKNIVSLHVLANTHTIVALDKAGDAYQFNTQTGLLTLIDSGVKQITESFYLKQNGTVTNWNKQALPNIPAMSRFVSSRKGDTASAIGGIGKSDSQLYYFQYSDNAHTDLTGAIKIGKYSQAQVILTDKSSYVGNTSPEYPAAVLDSDTWFFLNSEGKEIGQQKLPNGTVYTHIGGEGLGQYSPVLAWDGNLWYWSADTHNFVKSTCGNVKKTYRAELVLLNNGSIRPIIYNANGIGDVTCPETTVFDHLAAQQVKDMYISTGGVVVAITADNKLIERTYTYVNQLWKGFEAVYTVNAPN